MCSEGMCTHKLCRHLLLLYSVFRVIIFSGILPSKTNRITEKIIVWSRKLWTLVFARAHETLEVCSSRCQLEMVRELNQLERINKQIIKFKND